LARGKGHAYTVDFSLMLPDLPEELVSSFGNDDWPKSVFTWLKGNSEKIFFFIDPNWGSQEYSCKIGIKYNTKSEQYV
jgi:hypothetical protein